MKYRISHIYYKYVTDRIWTSPDCTTFSIAAISHHRRNNTETGNIGRSVTTQNFVMSRQTRYRTYQRITSSILFYWKSKGWVKKDVMVERFTEIHNYILSIEQYQNEANWYMDEPLKSTIQASLSQWRFIPQPNAKMCKTRIQGLKGSIVRSRIPEKLCEQIVDISENGMMWKKDFLFIVVLLILVQNGQQGNKQEKNKKGNLNKEV